MLINKERIEDFEEKLKKYVDNHTNYKYKFHHAIFPYGFFYEEKYIYNATGNKKLMGYLIEIEGGNKVSESEGCHSVAELFNYFDKEEALIERRTGIKSKDFLYYDDMDEVSKKVALMKERKKIRLISKEKTEELLGTD